MGFEDENERLGITVVAENIRVESRTKAAGVVSIILQDVHLSASPGEMVAIMGPSGSGKTTLLNFLSNRASRALTASGNVYFNGHSNELRRVNEFSAYVMQEDHFLEYLTVQETLHFAARLRLGHLPKSEQADRVKFCMEELGLVICKDVRIGGATTKGVSGGQKKRVSIAVALLSNPSLLFLDEPTSGLDASLSYDVVKTLENLVHAYGHTVVCTIHQPRSQVFALFDTLVLLRAGRVVYRGLAADALAYFALHGHVCPPEFNPPDFFLDLLTDGHSVVSANGPVDELELDIVRVVVSADEAEGFAKLFDESQMNQSQLQLFERLKGEETEIRRKTARKTGQGFFGFFRSVGILARREIKNDSRKPSSFIASIMQNLVMSAVIGSIWWQLDFPRPHADPADPCDSQRLRNLAGGIIQIASFIGFSAFEVAMEVVRRRPLLNREASSGLYKRQARFLSTMLSDSLHLYWGVWLTGTICYWCMGLRADAGIFFTHLLMVTAIKFGAVSMTLMCGHIAPNIPVATALVPLISVNLFLVSGFQLLDDVIPGWLVWLKAISYLRYIFQGLVRLQFDDDTYVYDCFGFRTPTSPWANIAIAFGLGVGFRVIAFIAMSFMHKSVGLTV